MGYKKYKSNKSKSSHTARKTAKQSVAWTLTAAMLFSGAPVLGDNLYVVNADEAESQIEALTSNSNVVSGPAVTDAATQTITNTTAPRTVTVSGSVFDAAKTSLLLGEKITENTPIGTNDYFTVIGTEGKNKLVSLETPMTSGYYSYTQALQLGGALNKSGKSGIQIVVPEGATAQITFYASAKSDKESILEYTKDGGDLTLFENGALLYDSIGKYVETLESGTYYLGGTNGANIFFMEVKYIQEFTLDAMTTDAGIFGEMGTKISADTSVGTNNFFTLLSKGNKFVIQDLSQTPLVQDGIEYTRAIQLTGGAKTNGQACIQFTTESKANITVYASAKSSAESILEYRKEEDGTFTEIGSLEENSVMKYTIPSADAGTYFLGGTNGANILSISVDYIEEYTLDAQDTGIAVGTKISEDTAVGEGDFYTLLSKGTKINIKDISTEPVIWGDTLYTTAIQLGGGAKTNGQACIKFTLDEISTVTVYAEAKSSAESILEFMELSDADFTKIESLEYGTIQKYVLEDLKPGTYYLGGTNGGNICRIVTEYDPSAISQTPWEDVETPVINQVSVNEDGNFVVDFTAVINEIKGADLVKVTMLESGYEVDTAVVKSQSNSVIMKPLWSGNYSFIVTAQRTGYPDKASDAAIYNNYVLALPKPVISWVQNKGDGTVYVDWINVKDADSFSIGYKLTSDEEYTIAAEGLTTGEYTLEGLNPGSDYDIIVYAARNEDGYISNDTVSITASKEAEQNWYVAVVGSAQTADITMGSGTTYSLNSRDDAAKKVNCLPAESIANTEGTITFAGSSSGKISDDEDGYMYYFTKIDPDTENFSLKATFTVTDTSLTPDNQTGFGVMAADMLGINYYGAPDYYHKYINSVANLYFSAKSKFTGMRAITGYESIDTSNTDDVTRTTTNQRFTNTTGSFEVGNSYTFELAKTNDSFIATCNGETLSMDDTSILSVQEDGTLCIGVMVSRKVSVEVSDMEFSTSESTGITITEKEEVATPKLAVYSSDTCGASTYEYICVPTVNGELTVYAPNGSVLFKENVEGDTAVRINIPISLGDNTIQASFTPDPSQNLTSYDVVKSSKKVNCRRYGQEGETIIVSSTGTADGIGNYEKPLDLATAVKYAQPGQIIMLQNGVYTSGVTIGRSVCGTEDKPITLMAEEPGEVVFEGSGITVIGDYWHIYGLNVKNAGGVGIQICGNYNVIEMCTVQGSGNSGFQLSRSGSASNQAGIKSLLWPSYNLIKNCESFDNCDSGRNDADGFAAKLTCGVGNRFYGCISHHNIDDGWDLYAKSVSGEIGSVTIENCVAYSNGWLTTDDTSASGYQYGEGNGFKLGGGYLKGGHMLINSISFNNGSKGITSNSCPDCEIINSISYHNSVIPDSESYNIGLNTKTTNVKAWNVSGVISMADTSDTTLEDLIPFSLHSANNYIYDGQASYNNLGEKASDAWFENTDVTIIPTRNEDGTIDMQGLLVMTSDAPDHVGARLDTTSDDAISIQPSITSIVKTVYTAPSSNDNDNNGDDDSSEDTKHNNDDTPSVVLLSSSEAELVSSVFGTAALKSVSETPNGKLITVLSGEIVFYEKNGTLSKDKWQLVNGTWYYFGSDNKAASGWLLTGGSWYYLDKTNKTMKTGWLQTEDGTWYLLDGANGNMKTGWQQTTDGTWYLLDSTNGNMKTGWQQTTDGKWYLLDSTNGDMKTGWQMVDGIWYYFNELGDMAADTVTPDGYQVSENGTWTGEKIR